MSKTNPQTPIKVGVQKSNAAENSIKILAPQEKEDFYNLPTSPATDTVMKIMGAGSELASLKESKTSHSQTIEVLQKGNKRQVIVTSGVSTVTLELSDIDKLIGSNKAAKKMFIFSLIKMNEQAYSDGALRRDYIQFPLTELIDTGNYKTPQSARKGFNNAMDLLTSLKLKGTLEISKKRTEEQSAIEVLFTGANIKKGTCTIYLNPRINWGFVAQFYTILPKYCFTLPNRAFDLLYYIFYIARQRVKDIEEKGYFTIGLRAIQERLNLPSEVNNKNPQITIKDPIEKAIEEIEEESKDLEFTITPIYDLDAPIANYLSNGYLKIGLSGKYATDFIALSKETAKQIKQAQNRKNAIIDKAKAINLSKKIESEEQTQDTKIDKN